MQSNQKVSELVEMYFNTDDEQHIIDADNICIEHNLMYDYICTHARFHDKNDLYWAATTGIEDFNNKCDASGLDGIEEQAAHVLITHNISVKQLHDAEAYIIKHVDYNKYYA